MKLTIGDLKSLIKEVVEEQQKEQEQQQQQQQQQQQGQQMSKMQQSANSLGRSELGGNLRGNKIKEVLPNLMLNDRELNTIKSLNPKFPKKAAFINYALQLLSRYVGN